MKNYSVTLNSDRVHLVVNGTPVETHLFSTYLDTDTPIEDAKNIAVGILVVKAMKYNNGGDVIVTTK